MYKTALKERYSYPSSRGNIGTEDLFRIPLISKDGFSLDEIAKCIHKQLKESEDDSFVKKSVVNTDLQNKLEIVKDIIADKLAEQTAKELAKANAVKKDKLLRILASKQDAALENKTEAEILAELEALG